MPKLGFARLPLFLSFRPIPHFAGEVEESLNHVLSEAEGLFENNSWHSPFNFAQGEPEIPRLLTTLKVARNDKEKRKQKILVALSGGVDSAVAAALLKKQGHDVTAVFMLNWQDDVNDCQWERDYQDAKSVAEQLGLKLFTWNFNVEYKKYVFDYFIKSYENGLTPNPDTLCNKYIKFGLFLSRALKLGFDKIATGHYARTQKHKNTETQKHENIGSALLLTRGVHTEGRGGTENTDASLMFDSTLENIAPTFRSDKTEFYKLITARDKTKDQSYFLYELGQHELSHTIFPLSDLMKKEVRKLAREFNLPVAEKKDSYGICFVGEKKMGEFLSRFIKAKAGEIVDKEGQILGRHNGLHFYTLGQRQRLGIGGTGPYYVVKKDYDKNQLIVTNNLNDADLFTQEFGVRKVNWVSGEAPLMPLKCLVRCRHLQKLNPAQLVKVGRKIKVILETPQKAIAGGQIAVFYQLVKSAKSDYEVLGGGIIHKNTETQKH